MILKRIFYAVWYLLDLVYNILMSAWSVILVIFSGKINPQVMVIDTKLSKRISQLVLANSITLTPGTLTIDVLHEEQKLIVAVLTPRSREEIIPFESLIGGVFE